MGYETNYAFNKLHGSEEDWEKFKNDVAKELDVKPKTFSEEECFYGRWYWEYAKPFLEETSKKYPDLLVEVWCEVDEGEHYEWKARFKNGESEEVSPHIVWEQFHNGNLQPQDEDPKKFTKNFLENVLSETVRSFNNIYPEVLSKRNTEEFNSFSGRNIVGRFIAKAILERLTYDFGPLEKDLKSKAGKALAGQLQAEVELSDNDD